VADYGRGDDITAKHYRPKSPILEENPSKFPAQKNRNYLVHAVEFSPRGDRFDGD
jgi:hypothetical protein